MSLMLLKVIIKLEMLTKKVLMMPKNQFDRYAASYSQNKDVQRDIAKKLLGQLNRDKYKKIIDVGSGDGAVFEEGRFGAELFVAVDSSPKMCALHEKHKDAIVLNMDFDNKEFASEILKEYGKFDLLISSSALQWSDDLGSFMKQASRLADRFAITVFTQGTFRGIREFLGVQSFLPTAEFVKSVVDGFCVEYFTVESSSKEFETPKDALRFIKTTGVSGGGNKISYHEAKKLYESGPKTLEFEVVYAVGSFAKRDFSIS
jgi:malonyl-CoA O-methyltransferase